MSGLGALSLELAVVGAGLAILLMEFWTTGEDKRRLGLVAAVFVGAIFLGSFALLFEGRVEAFGGAYVLDEFALYFKRLFLIAALLVLVMAYEFADRFGSGVGEYYALTLFALAGMMLAASAQDFVILFVAFELISVCFYVLVSYQRWRTRSLEAGMKYLVIGALAGAFLVYGIALIYGAAGTLNFRELALRAGGLEGNRLLQVGLLLVFVGMGFKVAVVPFQIWVPDVYQGAPVPTAAFLAVGSKAAGLVLLIRLLHAGVGALADWWEPALVVLALLTVVHGALAGVPQKNFRRLMGYSSIVNAGFLMLGVASPTQEGLIAVLFYLASYLYGVMGAFMVLCLARCPGQEDETCILAGLHRRSPLLAATLAVSMISLAGLPPAAGFFGKFLVFKAIVAGGTAYPFQPWSLRLAVAGAVVALYFYLNVVRTIYWAPAEGETAGRPIVLAPLTKASVGFSLLVLLWLGMFPGAILNLAEYAVFSLGW